MCSNAHQYREDPDYSPSAYIANEEQKEKAKQENREFMTNGRIDIAKVAYQSLWYDIEDYLFPIDEEEEELRVEDMDQEQLRQYYHEQGMKRMENMTDEEKKEQERKMRVS